MFKPVIAFASLKFVFGCHFWSTSLGLLRVYVDNSLERLGVLLVKGGSVKSFT